MASMPSVGDEAPDFSLVDTNGKTQRLSDYRGKSAVVLVFNRGFVWPYCRKHLAQLRSEYPEFTQRGAEILNLGPDDEKKYRAYWEKHDLPFPGLADPDHVVAKRYQQPFRWLKLGRMPMQLIVDKQGVIRYRKDGNSMSDIPAAHELFAVLDGLASA